MNFKQSLSHRVAILLAMSGLCAALSACVNKAQQNFTRPPAPVVVSTAVSQDVSNYMDALGKIVALQTVAIQPQISGRIETIHFTDGANLKKGQLLFTIDPRPFEASLKQAQANLAKDTAAKKEAEANHAREVAREKWGLAQVQRYSTLVEQGVVPREQYEQLRADYNSLKATSEAAAAAVHSAEETIKVDNAAIETAKVQLSYCYIHSPIDGRAGQRLVDIGNVVNPGGSNESNNSGSVPGNALLVIERLDPIYADFTISQNNLSLVQEQMRAGTLNAEVHLPDSPDDAIPGRLTFVDNAVQAETGQVTLRATLPNPGHRFWPGRFVNVRLLLGRIPGAVLVPASAPQMSANGSYVYVIKPDSTAEQRSVSLGQRQGDLVVVEKGVAAGEKVVVNGQLGVTPGGKVIEQSRETNSPATAAASGSKS
ncbi:MAG TPA: efflux RND transporter periplasmic adaptor subunit [Pyrinomonadaceae bacterium]|nr:efflux RND transporter periplasmic adaptor subunit [Pyrinomonadaceae bacterium]